MNSKPLERLQAEAHDLVLYRISLKQQGPDAAVDSQPSRRFPPGGSVANVHIFSVQVAVVDS